MLSSLGLDPGAPQILAPEHPVFHCKHQISEKDRETRILLTFVPWYYLTLSCKLPCVAIYNMFSHFGSPLLLFSFLSTYYSIVLLNILETLNLKCFASVYATSLLYSQAP